MCNWRVAWAAVGISAGLMAAAVFGPEYHVSLHPPVSTSTPPLLELAGDRVSVAQFGVRLAADAVAHLLRQGQTV
jgi:hypothetical protein